jgi:TctA family transporter
MNKTAWLSAPIGAVIIVGLATAASFAQSTTAIFIAASLVFSLCEGVVLAIVGYSWSRRGLAKAVLAAAATAAVAAPARWEVSLLRFAQPVLPMDLLVDLLVSIAWGALAGLAGATILRPRLAVLMRDNQR